MCTVLVIVNNIYQHINLQYHAPRISTEVSPVCRCALDASIFLHTCNSTIYSEVQAVVCLDWNGDTGGGGARTPGFNRVGTGPADVFVTLSSVTDIRILSQLFLVINTFVSHYTAGYQRTCWRRTVRLEFPDFNLRTHLCKFDDKNRFGKTGLRAPHRILGNKTCKSAGALNTTNFPD